MYRKLTDQEVKNLGRDILINIEFVISHAGDGEYSCNVFGGIYSSYWQALKHAREKSKTLDIYAGEDYYGKLEYFICENYGGNYYPNYMSMPKIAHLTLERINQDFDMGQ